MSYNKKSIAAIHVVETAKKLSAEKLIYVEQLSRILADFKNTFYSPSFFVRVGLFIFTLILVNAAIGIVGLTIADALDNEMTVAVLLLLAGVVIVGILEYFIHAKNHYRSGIDDCLLYCGTFFIVVGIVMMFNLYSALPVCYVVLPVLVAAVWRYADSFLALLAYACLLTIIFLLFKDLESGRLFMPFILAAVSAVFIFLINRLLRSDELYYYEFCLQVLKVAALLTFYLSVNYFVVREGNMMLNEFPDGIVPEIHLAWLFLGITIALPFVYIISGLRKYDKLTLWTGLGIMILTVLTIRYRFHIMPYEYALISGGLLLLPFSWFLIRYLKKHQLRYTFEPDRSSDAESLLNAEALLVSQTMGQPAAPVSREGFGGGSFGGGGAGGTI